MNYSCVNNEDIKRGLCDQMNTIEDVLCKLKKADFILSGLEGNYSYDQSPDPKAALKHIMGEVKSEHGQQSMEWYLEYERICTFIGIVSDYVFDSKTILENILNKNN